MKKIYIVTGATGFVGNNVVRLLLEKKETVYAFVRSKEKAQRVFKDAPLKYFYGDIRDKSAIDKMFDTSDAKYIFINTAAIVLIDGNSKMYREMRDVNINGVKNVIECCIEHKAKLLHVSSVHAITEPKRRALTTEITDFNPKKVHGPYAKTKAQSSALIMEAVKTRGLDAVLFHPSGITGPGDYENSHLTQMARDYLAGKIPAATNGGYDFVDVRDVAAGILLGENAEKGNCYLLTNKYYTVREYLDMLYEFTKFKKIKTTIPMWVAYLGLPTLYLVAVLSGRRPLYTSYSLYTLRSNSNFSHEKAARELGYKPRELRESVKDTLKFIEELSKMST
jgi:dihydroflavonol-4-reductase